MARRSTLELSIGAPLHRGDLEGLCKRICGELRRVDPVVAFVDVGSLRQADVVIVDALARLALGARRRGTEVRLRGVSDELRELLNLTGLTEVLPETAS